MNYDALIIGGGPAGLSTAIRIKQANPALTVAILEKGASIGAQIISGAVLEPRSLKELLPDEWKDAPLDTAVTDDAFYFMSEKNALKLPTPPTMKNHGNYIISLGELCRFLGQKAEALGCDIFPGFAAVDFCIDDKGSVAGVITDSKGVDKDGHPTANIQPGIAIHAKQTFLAEGTRGQLAQHLMAKFNLRQHASPQTYGLGIKELWRIPKENHHRGRVIHTIGWPLDQQTYGGSFIYHLSDERVAIGFVVGLDYTNTWLSPFDEMQRFKLHPFIRDTFEGGERLGYGARAINEGGYQSLPTLCVPGVSLIGDAAGFLNVPKIKGIHTAIKSGILAADAFIDKQSTEKDTTIFLTNYPQKYKESWLHEELYQVRNIRPGFKKGLWLGLANAFWETYITRGHSPWTLKNHADHTMLLPTDKSVKIDYPKPDGKLTFDRTSSVYLSNTYHEENQPCHLILKDPSLAITVNYQEYASPETRYCPAAVYEIVDQDSAPRLQINGQNCIHCKTCDIKDPRQNILWTAPEGGGGPNYEGM